MRNPKLEIYPNPFTTEAAIHYSSNGNRNDYTNIGLAIYDISGRLVKTTNGNMIGKTLKPGIYFLKTKDCNLVKAVKLK